jgi:hypothetical protein
LRTKLSLHARSALFLLLLSPCLDLRSPVKRFVSITAHGCISALLVMVPIVGIALALSACEEEPAPPDEPPGTEPPGDGLPTDTLTSVPTPLSGSCHQADRNATINADARATISRLSVGDTVAAMTGRGTCAGWGAWSEQGLTFAAAGGNVPNGDSAIGYKPGETIHLIVRDGDTGDVDSLYHQWQSCEASDSPICAAGTYAAGTIHRLAVLGEPPGNGEVFACAAGDSMARIDVPSESLAVAEQEGFGWKRRSDTTAENGSYIGALPNDGANVPADSAGDFSIPIRAHFCRAGTWQVRLRAAHSGSGASDDSFRLVSEDTTHTFNNLRGAEGTLGAVPTETWVPITDTRFGDFEFEVQETGVVGLHLRIREDGLLIDHLQFIHARYKSNRRRSTR